MEEKAIIKYGREAAYVKISRLLSSKLKNGILLDDSGKLPSYRELAAEFHVSVCVIQNAMRLLSSRSLIKIQHGKCTKAAFNGDAEAEMMKFALIHPYGIDADFGRIMPYFMTTVLDNLNCQAMIHVRTTQCDPKREIECAEQMRYNGVDGILLSPEYSLVNADYFMELSKSIPVMLIDQYYPGVNIPATVLDFAGGGNDIGTWLKNHNHTKVLALLNDRNNQSINDIINSMKSHVQLTALFLPIFSAEKESWSGDFRLFDSVIASLKKAMLKEKYDCIFSPFPRYIDLFYVNGIPDEMRKDKLCVVLQNDVITPYSRTFYRENLMVWKYSNLEMMQTALSRLIRWQHNKRRPSGIKKIRLSREEAVYHRPEKAEQTISQSIPQQ